MSLKVSNLYISNSNSKMKRFLIYITILLVVTLTYLIILEYLVGKIPNSYSYKYNYVKNNGGNIEALAIGHSQLHSGFVPDSFYLPSFNLCNSMQSFEDNYYILQELLPYMPHLKMVIMPIGYANVVTTPKVNDPLKTNSFHRRCRYYHKYMNIDYGGRLPFQYYYESFDPCSAIRKVYSYYINHSEMVGCDSLGKDNQNLQPDFGLGNLYTIHTRKERKGFSVDGEYFLLKTIKLLADMKITVIMVSPPYYWDCFKEINDAQKQFLYNYMRVLCQKYPVKYINLETDPTYEYDDFFNETHLGDRGAKKFTRQLNSIIQNGEFE